MVTVEELAERIEKLTAEKRILELEKEIEQLKKEIELMKCSQTTIYVPIDTNSDPCPDWSPWYPQIWCGTSYTIKTGTSTNND